jgi:aryl-alcohol dehydrogenase-like predicted oxidoreductase
VGETFAGVDFERGVAAAQDFAALVAGEPLAGPDGEPGSGEYSTAQVALAWVAQQPGVSAVIPGARSVEQAEANAAAGDIAPLSDGFLSSVRDLYDEYFRAAVHERW